MELRSPLSRARGLGSAKEGVTHWWAQRLTALALVPLVIWFCFSVARLPSIEYHSLVGWVASPAVAILLITTVIATLYHAYLGVQVIVEDYVHHAWWRTGIILAANFSAWLAGVVSVFCVLKLALGNSV